MPKRRRTPKILKRSHPSTITQEMLHKQLTCIQRDKENNLTAMSEANNDTVLTFMKIEVKEEELDNNPEQDFGQELNMPLKIEQFETLECNGIKQEEELSDNENVSALAGTSNADLNILIEWALNLQYDHSKKCTGRLYPCKEIFDNFRCKIVVLYCTVCKKKMLHTLKDWAML